MSKKTGVSVQKTKKLDKTVKADFKKIFTALSKAAIMFKVGQTTTALKEASSLIEAFQFAEDTPDLAYQLILTALVNAAHNLAEENSYYFNPKLEKAEKLYDVEAYVSFLEGISSFVEDKEIVLEWEMLKNPRSIPILPDFQNYFEAYLVLFGMQAHDASNIAKRLPSYFVFALNEQWSRNFSTYQPLMHTLDTPIAAAAYKERQWEAYYAYLEREVALPVFGESFSLDDVFMPLRAYYTHKTKNQQKATKEVVDLERSMDEWLSSSNPKDTIRMIQGGPGSGKSSFVKWWSAKIAKERRAEMLFFPLHYFNIHTNIKTAIGDYLKDSDHIPLHFNPLEDTGSFDKLLLVFDGLDELVMQGNNSKEAANAFMQELKTFCGIKNQGQQRIKVVVTGRPIVVQNVESKLRDGEEQIIRLLPYFLTEEQKRGYSDKQNRLAVDQRNEWWRRFFALKSMPETSLPKELQNPNMDKITAEPLLNYLVALSWQEAPEQFGEDTNINEIYHQLMEGVYKQGWKNERHEVLEHLTFDDFMQILEEIAVCAWQGGDARITTERKIEQHIQGKGLQSLLEEYKTSVKGGVSRLLTAFYFRKYGKEDSEHKDDTFEFTHKSFGEYLTARAIVELIKATHEERAKNKNKRGSRSRREGWTIEECLLEWLKTSSKSPLDKAIRAFIKNEIHIRKEAGEDIEAWQVSLTEVIGELVVTGMPLHLQKRDNQIEEMRWARNAEEALLVALACCAEVTRQLSSIEWAHKKSFSEWLGRLSSSLTNRDFAFRNLVYLDLEGADLEGTSLMHAKLQDANLQNAYLEEANLWHANLQYANLQYANLWHANLRQTGLWHANLQNAQLQGANLQNADLQNADLQNADLQDADLSGADLSGADLQDANLHYANLHYANLWNADLSGANLTLNQLLSTRTLFKAKGISEDLLHRIKKEKPNLLEPPPVWE